MGLIIVNCGCCLGGVLLSIVGCKQFHWIHDSSVDVLYCIVCLALLVSSDGESEIYMEKLRVESNLKLQ